MGSMLVVDADARLDFGRFTLSLNLDNIGASSGRLDREQA